MDRKRNNTASRLAELQSQLADEISAGLATCIDNLDTVMQGMSREPGATPSLLRRVKGDLITTKNLAALLANNLKPEPQTIIRENVVPLRAAE